MPFRKGKNWAWTDEDKNIISSSKQTPKAIYDSHVEFQKVPYDTYRSFYHRCTSGKKLNNVPIHSAETARGEIFFSS